MGKLQKFEIALDNPTGVYYAGQTVTGHVEVQLSESMNMRRKIVNPRSLVLW